MESRIVTIRAFCSAKGGVGKSTLAVLCANLLQQRGRRCVVIDADLTGSSLADGLKLCAPVLPLTASGKLDLEAPPAGAYYSREETQEMRQRRAALDQDNWRSLPIELPYLNDAFTYVPFEKSTLRLDSMLWYPETDIEGGRLIRDDALSFLPSSSVQTDIGMALPWLYDPKREDWVVRVMELLNLLAEQLPDLTDIVMDLSPGLFGFSQGVLRALLLLAEGPSSEEENADMGSAEIQWKVRPILVMTQDVNDLTIALEHWLKLNGISPAMPIRPLVNMRTLGDEQIRRNVPAWLREKRADGKLEFVDRLQSSLGKVFVEGALQLTDQERKLARQLGLEEG